MRLFSHTVDRCRHAARRFAQLPPRAIGGVLGERSRRHAWLSSAARGALLVLIGAAACRPDERGATPLRLAFVTNNAADFWTIARRGVEKAERELGDVKVDFRIPSDGTAAEQKRIIDDLLAAGTQGIAISPVDPANQVRMIDDAARQATVVTQDSDAPGTARVVYLGTDNRAAGRQAGDLIKEALPGGGTVVLFVGRLDAQNAQERYRGIQDALVGSNVRILDVRTDDTDPARAKSNAADALVKYPGIGALVGLWAYNGPAILNAVRDAGKIGTVRIVAFDEDDQTLAGVAEGAIFATVVQQPFEFGYQSIHMLARVARGDRSGVPPGKQIFIPTRIVRRADAGDFAAETRRLRGRN